MPIAKPFPSDDELLAQAAVAEDVLAQLRTIATERDLTAVEKRARTRAVRKLGQAQAMVATRSHSEAGDVATVASVGARIIWAGERKHLGGIRRRH